MRPLNVAYPTRLILSFHQDSDTTRVCNFGPIVLEDPHFDSSKKSLNVICNPQTYSKPLSPCSCPANRKLRRATVSFAVRIH